ncbi:MAG: hypothetical protein ABWZ16_06215 [Microbacterium sp.]
MRLLRGCVERERSDEDEELDVTMHDLHLVIDEVRRSHIAIIAGAPRSRRDG